jgi:spore coat protein A
MNLKKHNLILIAVFFAGLVFFGQNVFAQIPGGSLDPTTISKYVSPLVIPPAMPTAGKVKQKMAKNIDYYEIAMRQFQQQILPPGLPMTTVWSYGPVEYPGTVAEGGRFFYPAFTIEAKWKMPVRVKWINDLVDENGDFLPHLLPVDQTLHWANPVGIALSGPNRPDSRGIDPNPYMGPVPMITHVHGAHTLEESDGYPEAWYLPDANNIPNYIQFTVGSLYNQYKAQAEANYGQAWDPGTAVFQYPNDQRATTLWYHDHTLGMTRLNVYAGPAGFYLLRGGPDDKVFDSRDGTPAILPFPRPGPGVNPFGTFYEIPIAIQDRSFNSDGSLFFPDNRAFFEGLDIADLLIPFTPTPGCDGNPSDVAPIWNPEFFGNTMVVNGQTWPFLNVEQRRYRFRLLNGCQARYIILKFSDPNVKIWQIGAEGGFLPSPVNVNAVNNGQILMSPAERADVIVDFTDVAAGSSVTLLNLGPDEPFGGGIPDEDFDAADPGTTGQVMLFNVGPIMGLDLTTPPEFLQLPPITPLVPDSPSRKITLNEEESKNVFVSEVNGSIVYDCASDTPFGPTEALLGTLNADGTSNALLWSDAITENPTVGATEMWEIYNFTADAHPIHIHLVQFQVYNREKLEVDEEGISVQPAVLTGETRPPEAWETGFKDTVTVYPGEVARVIAKFDIAGLFVWHCHIVAHEDNEMMRPYRVVQ